MRRLIACLVLLVWAAPVLAGVSGRVSSIGFQAYIRAEQWVPLTVSIDSDEPAAHTFDLRIVQSDLDGDDVVYVRPAITVNPGQQTFRAYFRPETANGGLPASGTADAAELAKRLRVFLYDPNTKNTIRLGVAGAAPQALDTGSLTNGAGQKLILVVGRPPSLIEFGPGRLFGLAETCVFVQVDPRRLPDSALAYAAADAIIWTDADAGRLDVQQRKAIRDYVYGGGTLAVVQNADAVLTAPFADLLPVTLEQTGEWADQEPLRSLLMPRNVPRPRDGAGSPYNPWSRATGPFRLTSATPVNENVVVDTWATWPDGHRTPYIARRLLGSGCVAWLAQDVTDPTLATVNFGWPQLWERVFDWRDTDLYLASTAVGNELERQKQRFDVQLAKDLGGSFVSGMDVKGRTVALVSLSFIFFIGYWALAGPLSYVVLAARKRTQLSWLTFGAIALVATAITLGISALVLRGDAKLAHVSLVRLHGNEPARVLSNFGVYLPKDKRVEIALPQTPGGPPVSLTPFGAHPDLIKRDPTPRDSSYDVPITADAESATAAIDVPFRSTLKKLQADWTGPLQWGIGGKAVLQDSRSDPIDGRLSNDTGHDLSNVILIFRDGRDAFDSVLALPDWKHGQSIDLKTLWQSADRKLSQVSDKRSGLNLFPGTPVRGRWSDATAWLYEDLRRGLTTGMDIKFDDSPENGRNYDRSWPLVALFGRCPTMTNFVDETTRVDLLRRGVRQWDASPAVAAGALVIVAKSTGPLPLPLTVDGETPTGDGRLFFQAAVPLDRSAVNTPATQPTK